MTFDDDTIYLYTGPDTWLMKCGAFVWRWCGAADDRGGMVGFWVQTGAGLCLVSDAWDPAHFVKIPHDGTDRYTQMLRLDWTRWERRAVVLQRAAGASGTSAEPDCG